MDIYAPRDIIDTGFINCVAASILASGFLNSLEIKHFHADLFKHSAIFLITTDNRVYWQDFIPGSKDFKGNYTEITPDMICNEIKIPETLKKRLVLRFKNWNPYSSYKNEGLRVRVFNSETDLQCHIINSTGCALIEGNTDTEELIEFWKQAINFDPEYLPFYNGLGVVLSKEGRYEESLEIYNRAITIDPEYAPTYFEIGNILSNLNYFNDAIKAYEKFIEFWQDDKEIEIEVKKQIDELKNKSN